MAVDIEKLLRSEAHSEFVASLNPAQSKAMLDLLLVASLADDIITVDERTDIARAFTQHPDLKGTLNLFSSPLIDYIDALAAHWRDDPDAILTAITEGLDDAATREKALSAAVFVMRTDELVEEERGLIRKLAELWDIDRDFVQAALIEVSDE